MLTNEYLKRVYAEVESRDGHEPEFLQAVREVFGDAAHLPAELQTFPGGTRAPWRR